jgi:hypothetical protein
MLTIFNVFTLNSRQVIAFQKQFFFYVSNLISLDVTIENQSIIHMRLNDKQKKYDSIFIPFIKLR